MFDPLVCLVSDFNMVCAGLGYDKVYNHRLAVAAEEALQVFGRQFRAAYVAEADNPVFAFLYY